MFLGPVLHENSIAAISGGSWSVNFWENNEKQVKFVFFLINPSFKRKNAAGEHAILFLACQFT
jgi:hypothetical protein